MEGFKTNPKMQCFKEGGQVKYETRKEHKEEIAADINQDKKVVKKAFKMHDTQSHEGEKTNLSKLKKGGRAKKTVGTVNKYKAGGTVSKTFTKEMEKEFPKGATITPAKFDKASGQYGAKKTAADNKNIKEAKQFKVKKLADGGMTGMGAVSDEERAQMEEMVRPSRKGQGNVSSALGELLSKGVSSPRDTQGAMSELDRSAAKEAARQLKGQGVVSDNERQRQMDRIKRAQKYLGPSQQGEFGGQEREFLGRKKGGKIKKMNTGGTCS